jgi:2-C-methyl-D-erythritol 4-phosphate cytidylyltransferase
MSSIVAILPAAGLGTRMGADAPKQFRLLDGVPVVVFTLRRLAASPLISSFLIATHADEIEPLKQRIAAERFSRPFRVLAGGDTRQESVAKALAEVPEETELVVVHDAVRPLVTRDQAEVKRASLPEDAALITATIPRERIVLAQTPQVFDAGLLREAFARAAADGFTASDEAALVERLGHNVHVVLGSERNLKITRPGDLEIAEFYLSRERMAAEVGR